MHGRAKVIVKEAMTAGLKSRILGYMSRGERVPEVITTDWKRSNTGLMAILESRQLKNNFSYLTGSEKMEVKISDRNVTILNSKGFQ